MSKRIHMKCPYCGAPAVKRPAAVVHGEKLLDPDQSLYVCSRYPACDAYVAIHKTTGLPMGTLANGALRRKRIEAHRAFDRLWKEGHMERWQAYRWLQAKLDLPSRMAHIALFSDYMCDQVTRLCEDFGRPDRQAA